MPISRASLLGGLAALGLAGAGAWAQQKPESILPPGFNEPGAPAPAPTASSTPTPRPSARPGEVVQPLPSEGGAVADATPTPSPTPTPTPTQDPAVLAEYELPSFARRSLDTVGAIGPAQGGVPSDAFGQVDGRRLEIWMRRLRAPIASRWAAITLRRALVSQIDTPSRVNGADFAAERAWLLLRMGEAVAARGVVQSVDNGDYTPKLYQIALQTALATADPAAICQVEAAARARDPERAWVLAHAICTSLSGSPAAAQALVTAARRGRVARGVDLSLAQKVVAVGGQGKQAVTVEWDDVDQLTAWRWGLATATGVEVPDRLYASAGPQVSGWRALAPAIPLARRAAAAETAAGWGVISSEALVDLYAATGEADDSDSDQTDAAASGVAADLRTAYADPSADARRAALGRLWSGAAEGQGYARLVLTARAAATIAPRVGDNDADRLVAAMLSAGLDRTALRWRDAVSEGSDAWAMLLLADPDAFARLPYRTLGRYAPAADATLKQRFLFAGLAGLGRLSGDDVERGARELGVPIGRENAWTRAIDRAAQANEPGTAILLAALGLQTRDWRGVPPDALFHIVAALRATGLEGPARMIAAEAIARA